MSAVLWIGGYVAVTLIVGRVGYIASQRVNSLADLYDEPVLAGIALLAWPLVLAAAVVLLLPAYGLQWLVTLPTARERRECAQMEREARRLGGSS